MKKYLIDDSPKNSSIKNTLRVKILLKALKSLSKFCDPNVF